MSGFGAGKNVTALDRIHAAMHRGEYFVHTGNVSLLAAGILDHLIRIPAGVFPHFRFLGVESSVAPIKIWLYEAPTVTATGTLHASNNVKRYSYDRSTGAIGVPAASQVTFSHNPTVTNVGALLLDLHLVSGTQQTGGTGGQSFMEFLMRPQVDYLVRIQNVAQQTADIVYTFEHYEESHPEVDG